MDINNYIASGIIEMYVMGMCTDEEKKELESLRGQYPELHHAIQEFEIRFEKKMQNTFTLPGSAIDDKILRTIETLRLPAGKVVSLKTVHTPNKSWWKAVAAAALVFLFISSYFNYTLYQKGKRQEQELKTALASANKETLPQADYNILKDPSITPVAMYGVGTHSICRCTLFWDKKTGKLYMMIHHLPQSSGSQDYQLWATVNGNMVNVGLIKDEIRGRFIEIANVPAGSTAFTVTLEKAGGSITPTMEEAYLAGRI